MLIQPYTEKWIQDFQAIKSILQAALSDCDVSIEHVGSTAVPQLAAKPIIDIDIVLDTMENFEMVKMRLEKIGYYHNGNQGIENRDVFKRNKTNRKEDLLAVIDHHLYVCPAGSEPLQQHLLFRDYLIAHAEARAQYENLKLEIAAAAHQDRKRYASLKEEQATDFIFSILEKAKYWQRSQFHL